MCSCVLQTYVVGLLRQWQLDFFFLQLFSQNLAMNECKARNKELHLHIEELQMRVGGRGGWGVCTRGGGGRCGMCVRRVERVWSVYQGM